MASSPEQAGSAVALVHARRPAKSHKNPPSEEPTKSVKRVKAEAEHSSTGAKEERNHILATREETESNLRALAEAWGLTEPNSDDEDAEIEREDARDEKALNRGAGLGGVSKGREETNKNSLEARVDRAQQRKKKAQESSVELSEWSIGNDDDAQAAESSLVTKSKSATTGSRHKQSLRIKKTFDALSS